MAFIVLSISQLFLSFSLRSNRKSIFKSGILKNKALVLSLVLGIVLQLLIVFVPFLSSVFKTYPLSIGDFEFIFLISLVPLVINEISKFILNMFRK